MKFRFLLFIVFIVSSAVYSQNTRGSYVYDKPANFPESNGDFVTYIKNHLQKPDPITEDAKGRLTIKIEIDEMGRASVINMPEKVSSEIEEAFLKAILAAPAWAPASLKGKAVKYSQMAYYYITANKTKSAITVDALNAQPKEVDTTKIYNAVDVNPAFPDGEAGFSKFLSKHIKYPETAKQNNVRGRVFVQFIVERDGNLSNIVILRDPGSGLGDEAVRVMRLSPKWIPGIKKGKIVRVQFTVPINFSF